MRALLALPLLIAASATTAAQPDWSHARSVEVRLSSFDFDPDTIRLRAGQPIVLHLVNTGNGGHNFAAPQFFSAATVRPEEARLLHDGAVEVPGHQARDIHLVPARGSYRLRCTHTLHSTLGMRGEIVVE